MLYCPLKTLKGIAAWPLIHVKQITTTMATRAVPHMPQLATILPEHCCATCRLAGWQYKVTALKPIGASSWFAHHTEWLAVQQQVSQQTGSGTCQTAENEHRTGRTT
jgi:hypothetical protein